ncbi:MAG: zinc ribbon domain-containing protein [Solirubrobacterales bacterium]|nr:zinc ribbon domain-containing protein [Solirubrobacterales bacterium]
MAGPICPACGAPLPSDARFCNRCGAPQEPPRQTPSWRGPLIVVAVVLVLSAIAFGLAYSQLSAEADDEARAAAQPVSTGQ